MSKRYYVELQFGRNNNSWATISGHNRQTDAMDYIRINSGERYPMRIVRVIKTVVFEESKEKKNG